MSHLTWSICSLHTQSVRLEVFCHFEDTSKLKARYSIFIKSSKELLIISTNEHKIVGDGDGEGVRCKSLKALPFVVVILFCSILGDIWKMDYQTIVSMLNWQDQEVIQLSNMLRISVSIFTSSKLTAFLFVFQSCWCLIPAKLIVQN